MLIANNKSVNHKISAGFRYLLFFSAMLVFTLIVLGGVVRVSEAGGACPDWPACFGQFTPPSGGNALIDYAHRFATFLATGLVLMSTVVAWKKYKKERLVLYPLILSTGLLFLQTGLGAWIARAGVDAVRAWITAIHLGVSLLILGLILMANVFVFYRSRLPEKEIRLEYRSPFARLSLINLVAVLVLLVSGAVIAGSNTSQACAMWPLCSGPAMWTNLSHRLLVLISAGLLAWMFVRAWRSQKSQIPIIVASTAAFVLFTAQALLGARLVVGFPVYLLALHQATAVSVWGTLIIVATSSGLARRAVEDERAEIREYAGRKGILRDLLMLTKPVVVALLLVTTYAGMVIGSKVWPSLSLTFWTLLGGFMAAGGSGAINQYIDRYDDVKMQRTQKRPIPSGRLTPGEGLAFGVAMAIGSFYLMVAFVNFLAALLTLAGIIYYVLLYSIILKKTTVQNIVIGGGAGAIPPLVGWAAATGSLNLPSLFLFALVFMWTPPHFWALALVRRKDYARAGVPMLPVVRGEQVTRWQIFLYTLELVGLTLLLPIFGLGGSIYFVAALVLGGWLLSAAWKVWKQGGNKLAWKMYRYSSMYLAFIFIVLMVDALL